MCGVSLTAAFGICEVFKKSKKIGKTYELYSAGYAPARSQ